MEVRNFYDKETGDILVIRETTGDNYAINISCGGESVSLTKRQLAQLIHDLYNLGRLAE